MATMTQTKSGFGFLGFAAIMVAALLIVSMGAGALATSVMMTESTAGAKAPANMDDAELQAEIEAAEVEVVAAWDKVKDVCVEGADQATIEAAIAARTAANERYIAANEVAIARGWYKYDDTELAALASTKMIVLDLPGEGATEVAIGHIATKHGTEAVQAVRTGGWKNGNCNGGKKGYAYKPADDGRWWVRVSWNGKVVTCYRVTWELLLYYFKQDGCEPPRPPFGHDAMSSPAY